MRISNPQLTAAVASLGVEHEIGVSLAHTSAQATRFIFRSLATLAALREPSPSIITSDSTDAFRSSA